MSKIQYPSFTKTYHHKPYPAVDPTRPELSAEGKVVFITGAGSGIGRATAIAFAQANAHAIILTGRRDGPLNETESLIESQGHKSTIVCHTLDVTDESNIQTVFTKTLQQFHHIDILIHGAGHLANPGSLTTTSTSNFYTSFDVHVKGTFLLHKAFASQPSPPPIDSPFNPEIHHPNSTSTTPPRERILIAMSSFLSHLLATQSPTAPASYSISKLAQSKLIEYIASEHLHDTTPPFRAYAVQPGIVVTDMSSRSIDMAPPGTRESLVWDDPALSGGFFVWLASGRGRCVPSGRFLWVNWDVEELEGRQWAEEEEGELLMGLNGWPFGMPEVEL